MYILSITKPVTNSNIEAATVPTINTRIGLVLKGITAKSTYVSVCTGNWVNRGFMRGPVIPIYGTGAVIVLSIIQPKKQ